MSGNTSHYTARAAVVIGIDRYSDPAFDRLTAACRDAQLFRDTLVDACGLSADSVTLLLNEQATLERIKRTIETVGRAMPEQRSQMIVYFAGHGESLPALGTKRIGVLVPFDGVKATWSTGLSMSVILELADLIRAHHVLFVLDCCFSGLAGRISRAAERRHITKMLGARCRQMLVASLSDEAAFEDAAFRHGIYTRALCNALRNPPQTDDRFITASGLHAEVARTVRADTAGNQNPRCQNLMGFEEGDNVLRELPPMPARQPRICSPRFEEIYGAAHHYQLFDWPPYFDLSCVLPLEKSDIAFDHPDLLAAEQALLAELSVDNILATLEMMAKYGLLAEGPREPTALYEFYEGDPRCYSDFVGTAYANAGHHKLALRWYREDIAHSNGNPADDEVYAAVGYSLLQLGFHDECIEWTRVCAGTLLLREAVYDTTVRSRTGRSRDAALWFERAATKVRCNVPPSSLNKLARHELCGYLDWRLPGLTVSIVEGDPPPRPHKIAPRQDADGGAYPLHRMNLLLAQLEAASLTDHPLVAQRILEEALTIEPSWDLARTFHSALGPRKP